MGKALPQAATLQSQAWSHFQKTKVIFGNKASMLMKTKDRIEEQSQNKAILFRRCSGRLACGLRPAEPQPEPGVIFEKEVFFGNKASMLLKTNDRLEEQSQNKATLSVSVRGNSLLCGTRRGVSGSRNHPEGGPALAPHSPLVTSSRFGCGPSQRWGEALSWFRPQPWLCFGFVPGHFLCFQQLPGFVPEN